MRIFCLAAIVCLVGAQGAIACPCKKNEKSNSSPSAATEAPNEASALAKPNLNVLDEEKAEARDKRPLGSHGRSAMTKARVLK